MRQGDWGNIFAPLGNVLSWDFLTGHHFWEPAGTALWLYGVPSGLCRSRWYMARSFMGRLPDSSIWTAEVLSPRGAIVPGFVPPARSRLWRFLSSQFGLLQTFRPPKCWNRPLAENN